MHVNRHRVVQALVIPFVIAEVGVGGSQALPQCKHRAIVPEADAFVLDCAPQALDEDAVEGQPSTIVKPRMVH
jgi:hypothetical protein